MNIQNRHYISGQTNDKGEFHYSNVQTTREFFNRFPSSKFIVKFEVIHPDISNKQLFWFNEHILPQIQDAYFSHGERLSLNQTEERLKEVVPLLIDSGKEIKELTTIEFNDMLEFIYQYCSENLETIINE